MTESKNNKRRNANQREVSQEKRFRQLGTRTPKCDNCDERDVAALTGRLPKIECYECQATKSKRSPIEAHHPAGRHNDSFTVSIPGNAHRILSDEQTRWPPNTLRNPNASPLRKAAAWLRGLLDTLQRLIVQIIGWIPDYLEKLDAILTERFGKAWWKALNAEVSNEN